MSSKDGFDKNREDEVKLSSVEIESAGRVLRVTLMTIGPDDGLITAQAAGAFNTSESTVLKHLTNHRIPSSKLVTRTLQLLKNNGVVSTKSRHAVFIPRYGLRELMRVIGNDEAKAAYHQLFDDAEELMRIKPILAEQKKLIEEKNLIIEKLEVALAQSNMDIVSLRQSIDNLNATNSALERHIVGNPKRNRKFNVVIGTEHRVNMFGERDDVLHIEKKPLEEMNQREKKDGVPSIP